MKPTHCPRETIRRSMRWICIGGRWYDEVAKRMLGTVVIEVQVRDGRWFDITQVERR